jgi:hypothetical protein
MPGGIAVADTHCPHCDHVFDLAEITEEWCAACGRKIPEVLLKEVRPKPHIRNPHPHPLPPPTKETIAEESRETQIKLVGLLLMLAAIVLGIAALSWGTYTQMSGHAIGVITWIAGGTALLVFLVGVILLNRGRGQEE